MQNEEPKSRVMASCLPASIEKVEFSLFGISLVFSNYCTICNICIVLRSILLEAILIQLSSQVPLYFLNPFFPSHFYIPIAPFLHIPSLFFSVFLQFPTSSVSVSLNTYSSPLSSRSAPSVLGTMATVVK